MAARSEEKAKEAIKAINEKTGKEANLVFLPFDMTDLKSIKKAAETVKEKEDRLDIVVNNAGEPSSSILLAKSCARLTTLAFKGVMAWPYKIVNGVEVQFVRSHSHFFLPSSHSLILYTSFYSAVEPPRSLCLHPLSPSSPQEHCTTEWVDLSSHRQRLFPRSHFLSFEPRFLVYRGSEQRLRVYVVSLWAQQSCKYPLHDRSTRPPQE